MREIIGNYNLESHLDFDKIIIPLREIIGNYNEVLDFPSQEIIIPLREIIGNYNVNSRLLRINLYYTLERDNRELQPTKPKGATSMHYTLERDNRELQPRFILCLYRGELYP